MIQVWRAWVHSASKIHVVGEPKYVVFILVRKCDFRNTTLVFLTLFPSLRALQGKTCIMNHTKGYTSLPSSFLKPRVVWRSHTFLASSCLVQWTEQPDTPKEVEELPAHRCLYYWIHLSRHSKPGRQGAVIKVENNSTRSRDPRMSIPTYLFIDFPSNRSQLI